MNPGPHRCPPISPPKILYQFGSAGPPKPASAHKACLTRSSGSWEPVTSVFVCLILHPRRGDPRRLTNLLKPTVHECETAWPCLCGPAWGLRACWGSPVLWPLRSPSWLKPTCSHFTHFPRCVQYSWFRQQQLDTSSPRPSGAPLIIQTHLHIH